MVWRGEINLNEGWEKSVGGHVKASWPVGEREQSLRLGGRASFSHLYKAAEGRRGWGCGVGGTGHGGKDCQQRGRRHGAAHGPHLCFSPSSSPSLSCLVLGSPSSLSCKRREKTTCSDGRSSPVLDAQGAGEEWDWELCPVLPRGSAASHPGKEQLGVAAPDSSRVAHSTGASLPSLQVLPCPHPPPTKLSNR